MNGVIGGLCALAIASIANCGGSQWLKFVTIALDHRLVFYIRSLPIHPLCHIASCNDIHMKLKVIIIGCTRPSWC